MDFLSTYPVRALGTERRFSEARVVTARGNSVWPIDIQRADTEVRAPVTRVFNPGCVGSGRDTQWERDTL